MNVAVLSRPDLLELRHLAQLAERPGLVERLDAALRSPRQLVLRRAGDAWAVIDDSGRQRLIVSRAGGLAMLHALARGEQVRVAPGGYDAVRMKLERAYEVLRDNNAFCLVQHFNDWVAPKVDGRVLYAAQPGEVVTE